MKKAYRIEFSRYPPQEKFILATPEELNKAYEKIKKNWINQSKTLSITQRYLSENYVNGMHFVRIIIPSENYSSKDVISIDLGTQLEIENLKRLSKRLGLPFDEREARRE